MTGEQFRIDAAEAAPRDVSASVGPAESQFERAWLFQDQPGALDRLNFDNDGLRRFGTFGLAAGFAGHRIYELSAQLPGHYRLPRAHPVILFDSNLYPAMAALVEAGTIEKGETEPDFRLLISALLEWDASVSPICYFLENERPFDGQSRRRFLERMAQASFRLNTINVDAFRQTGRILSDPSRAKSLCDRLAVRDEKEYVSVELSDETLDPYRPGGIYDAIYIALLSAHRINIEYSAEPIIERFFRYIEFMGRELRASMGRIVVAAFMLFKRKLARLFRVDRTTSFEITRQRLRGAAWDVYFTMLPEDVAVESTDEFLAGFICSQDQGLLTVASASRILLLQEDHEGIPSSIIGVRKVSDDEVERAAVDEGLSRLRTLLTNRERMLNDEELRKLRQRQERALRAVLGS